MFGTTAVLLSTFIFATSTAASSWASSNSTVSSQQQTLGQLALGKVLQDAAPIFGDYVNVQSNTSLWMKAYPDSVPVVHMNIPGTHDTDTWNYSLATQKSLLNITNLVNLTEVPPEIYRCQDVSIIGMLNAGIRAFDLRYAYDVTASS